MADAVAFREGPLIAAGLLRFNWSEEKRGGRWPRLMSSNSAALVAVRWRRPRRQISDSRALQSFWRQLVGKQVVSNETTDFVGFRGTDQSYANTVTSSLRETVVVGRGSNL